MIKNKLMLAIGIVFILGILFVNLAVAQIGLGGYSGARSFSGSNRGTASYVNYGAPFTNYYSAENRLSTYWPILGDRDSCQARQDILIQVNPAGCQPAVVRSDLLAEQNVPVFCELSALTVNPAIDVKQIRNIRFNGQYPPEVAGVGFHPAQAALRTNNQLLGSPLNDNIGYVVVVLKRQPNENITKDFLKFTLGASIDYYSGNAIGVGKTEFLLKEVPDNEWNNEKIRQSFFKGQYSIRMRDSNPESINLEVYKGDVKVSSVKVDKRKSSNEIYLPGSYCQTALQFSFDDYVSPDKIARLQVDSDIVDAYVGSTFLNGKCSVRKIDGDGTDGTVTLSCGNQQFVLNTKYTTYAVNTEVKLTSAGEKQDEIWIIDKVNTAADGTKTYDLKKKGTKGEGSDRKPAVPSAGIRPLTGRVLEDKPLQGSDVYFDNAVSNYSYVAGNYGNEKFDAAGKLYGEVALERAIALALRTNKELTAAKLIDEYLERYPSGENAAQYGFELNRLYTVDSSLSSVIVDIDAGAKIISLREVISPKKKSSATINWNELEHQISLGGSAEFSRGGSISVTKIRDADNAEVSISCKDNAGVFKKEGTETIRLGNISNKDYCGNGKFRLTKIDLEEFAKVRITPVTRTGTITNFTVGIGIEKRAFELTPSQARKKIENLNKTIKEWTAISNSLGKVVTGLKAACLATAAVLTVKNFFTGLSGEALARQQIMRGPGGWTKFCEGELNAKRVGSMTQCYNQYADEISKDIDSRTKAIAQVNKDTKQIEESNKISRSGPFGGDSFNEAAAKKELWNKAKTACNGVDFSQNKISGVSNVNALLDKVGPNAESISYEQLRDIYLNCLVSKSSGGSAQGVSRTRAELDTIGYNVNERANYEKTTKDYSAISTHVLSTRPAGNYYGDTVGSLKDRISGIEGLGLDKDTPVQTMRGKFEYLAIMHKDPQGNLIRDKTYLINNNNGAKTLGPEEISFTEEQKKNSAEDLKIVPQSFVKTDARSYYYNFAKGEYQVRYFETEPYKGMPAIVPFESQGFSGFYAATTQNLPIGTKSFESSGRPSTFWICNVMKDGRVDFSSGSSIDDECLKFDFYSGQSSLFPGLNDLQTKRLIVDATRALQDAAQGYGQKDVIINGKKVHVGNAAAVIPATQCQDYMSPEDCKILFNVCDPVICPASRCNLGGAYPVADVIQTGVVGSVLLCLPNVKEGIVVPVCLTGIQAGIDGYLSIMKSYQQCLQENIDTGKYVGICDQISSVYMCEFFWRQLAPIANVVLPKIVEAAYTGSIGSSRGGGEYLTVQNSWQNAQDSVKYFTQSYAVNSFNAFNIRSIEEAGTPFCQAFVSAKGPKTFETLIEPESPPQFNAWYSEISYTDATVPATSQYSVFYHIFAGKQRGISFSVYLKDPPTNTQYSATPYITVATGFIPRGQFATEKRDFTAPKGYKQLCVRIDNKEECGFKQVTSSFALDYVRDNFVADQLKTADIKTERACNIGSANTAALLNPNLGAIASEAVDPAIYNRGIVRICSTSNPGTGTDPSRFVNVGYCDDPRIGCWLDKKGVDSALSQYNVGAKETTLAELEKRQKDYLASGGKGFKSEDAIKTDIAGLGGEINGVTTGNVQSIVAKIDLLISQSLFNYQTASLWMMKADLYAKLFSEAFGKGAPKPGAVAKGAETGITSPATGAGQSSKSVLSMDSETYDPTKKINILLNERPTGVSFESNIIYYQQIPIGRIIGENIDLEETQFETIVSIFGSGSYEKLDGINVRSLEYGGSRDLGTGTSTETSSSEKILKLEKSYNPTERIYFLLNGQPTKLYVLGREIKIDQFAFLEQFVPAIGTVVSGDNIKLINSESNKKKINDLFGVSTAFDAINNGYNINEEIDLKKNSNVATLGNPETTYGGYGAVRIISLRRANFPLTQRGGDKTFYFTDNSGRELNFFTENSQMYLNNVNVGEVKGELKVNGEIKEGKITLLDDKKEVVEAEFGFGTFDIINGKDVKDNIDLGYYKAIYDNQKRRLPESLIKHIGDTCARNVPCYSECLNDLEGYFLTCEEKYDESRNVEGFCDRSFVSGITPVSPGNGVICKNENGQAVFSTPPDKLSSYCSGYSVRLFNPYGDQLINSPVDLANGALRELNLKPVGNILPIGNSDEILSQLSSLKNSCGAGNINQIVIFAHGDPGEVILGDYLTSAWCNNHKQELKEASPFGTTKGMVIFNSCSVNEGGKGVGLAQCFADALNADVYMSSCAIYCSKGVCSLPTGKGWDKFTPSS